MTSKKSTGLVKLDDAEFFRRLARNIVHGDGKGPTRHERALMDAAVAVQQQDPSGEDLKFSCRELVQCSLPHRDPGDVRVWERRNGDLTLTLISDVGYPYGPIPRLLLVWMTSEAVRTGHRRLEFGDTYNAFLRAMGLDPATGGGKRGDATRVREQGYRLFNAVISVQYAATARGVRGKAWSKMLIAEEGMLWWDPRRPDQRSIFPSFVELSEKFFKAVTVNPVPLDMRALQALKHSSLALDLYTWAAHRAFGVAQRGKTTFVPWRALAAQMGDYADVKDFKKKALAALQKILLVYPALKLDIVPGGLKLLSTSRPPITPLKLVMGSPLVADRTRE